MPKKAPEKLDSMNGEMSRLWDMVAHVNSRVDGMYKWGFLAVVAIIASQWGSEILLSVLGVSK